MTSLRCLAVSVVGLVIACPSLGQAVTILGIDINGDIYSISTETGSFTTLGSTGLPSAHTLARAPNGLLYTMSGVGDNDILLIDETDFSTSVVGTGTTVTGGEGGLVFISDTMAYATTRAAGISPVLLEIDLNAGSVTGFAVLPINDDLSALTLRDDGMLVAIGRQSNSLFQIDPNTAAISVIANLSGLTVLSTGGLVQVDGVAFFATSFAFGGDTEIWSIDLYTGANSLVTTISGLYGITGLATIPEPSTALLFALGLTFLASRRSRSNLAIALLAFPLLATPQSASASNEIEAILDKACSSGLLTQEACAELMACLTDPTTCQSAASTGGSGTTSASAMLAGGGGAAMAMGSLPGASISFRIDNTGNPRMSPSASQVAFDEGSGVQRTHRAIFGDGVPAGTEAPSPNPFGAHSTTLGGIDDSGLIVGTRSQGTAPVSQSYIANTSIGVFFTLTDNFSNTFDLSSGFDVDFNSTRAAGSVFDTNVGVVGKNYPAHWEFNTGSGLFELRRFNGLSAAANLNIGEFRAITPAGTFAVGASGSANTPPLDPFGRQAFLFNRTASSFTALPFLPSAATSRSDANALSDATDIIIGTATNSSGNNVATAWFDVSGTYFEQELPRFGSATSSQGLTVAGDGLSIDGSIGAEAAVWDGITFQARRLEDIVLGIGLIIPTGCTLSSVNDMDELGFRVVGEATCDNGGGPFTRVYELEVPLAVPEPGLKTALFPAISFLAFLVRQRMPTVQPRRLGALPQPPNVVKRARYPPAPKDAWINDALDSPSLVRMLG